MSSYFRKIIIALLICGFFTLTLWLGHIDPSKFYKLFSHLLEAHPYTGVLLIILIQILVVLSGVFPASIPVIGAGLVLGPVKGFIAASFAVFVGALLAFAISRSFLRKSVHRMCRKYPLFNVLEETATQKGWKVVCLLRLSPVLPFAITSYAIGLTDISLKDYIVGTFFSLPPLFGYVLVGCFMQHGAYHALQGDWAFLNIILNVVYIVSTVMLVWLTSRVFVTYMKKHSRQDPIE